jgi:hypothetical protein
MAGRRLEQDMSMSPRQGAAKRLCFTLGARDEDTSSLLQVFAV